MNFIKIKFGNSFEEEFQKAVDEVFHLVGPVFKNYEYIWRPNLDIYESAEEIIVLADLAGLNKDEIHIELSRKRIKIAGVRKAIMIMTNARYSLAEIPHGYFERTLSLPALVDVESAVASYANGLLMVRIKKMPAGKTLRVQIKSNNE